MAWTMLLIIGTGHVFKIDEQVRFIIKNTWPDAVLVELDEKRFKVMDGTYEHPKDRKPIKLPGIVKSLSKAQSRTASQFGTYAGLELLEACRAGKAAGAEVILMDGDVVEMLLRMWDEMSFIEKLRWRVSGTKDRRSSRKDVEKIQNDFSDNEKEYMDEMRRRYPTMMRILHKERNEAMAKEIVEASKRHDKMVAVVGDAHVEGIVELLPKDMDVRKVRLADIRDEQKIGKLMSDIWYERLG